MTKIIRQTGTGKTLDLFKEAAKVNGIILCEDVPRIKRKMYTYGFNLAVGHYSDYKEASGPVFIHDIEKFTEYILESEKIKLSGYTLSND